MSSVSAVGASQNLTVPTPRSRQEAYLRRELLLRPEDWRHNCRRLDDYGWPSKRRARVEVPTTAVKLLSLVMVSESAMVVTKIRLHLLGLIILRSNKCTGTGIVATTVSPSKGGVGLYGN